MPWEFFEKNDTSFIDDLEKELPESSTFLLLLSIVCAIAWAVYIVYYNSLVIGHILTIVLNRFVKYGRINIGSFSISVLSGKIMFRDAYIITEDFALRIHLGYAIFRWWQNLIIYDANEDLSHAETRLTVYIDSCELHVFNRSQTYARLEKLFGLDQLLIPKTTDEEEEKDSRMESPSSNNKTSKWNWRALIPVIKFEISAGRIVFGNQYMPYVLSLNFGEARLVYTTKPASTPFDIFMHVIKCHSERLRVLLVPSQGYSDYVEKPPRHMGDGFVVLQSGNVDIYYYFDEPGVVPYEPESVHLADGDVVTKRTWPCWGMDVKCGKVADINYGPWVDRQREYLWKFFYPSSYEPIEVTKLPEPGQKRVCRSFDFKMSMQGRTTIDILFNKNKDIHAIHLNCKQGSYLEFTIPWVIDENGYVTQINGQLMHLESTTSLLFTQLMDCETLQFLVEIKYPRMWNGSQDWRCDFTACKASGNLVFYHKMFFMDLLDDWASRLRPDIYRFIPYTLKINFMLKEFELALVSNEWNWINCSGQNRENSSIAFCGETFDLSVTMPFVDFLPETVPLTFFIRGEGVDLRMMLPSTNTSKQIITALSKNMKIVGRDGKVLSGPFQGMSHNKWRKITQEGWVDCCTTPIVALEITYTYHPIPLLSDVIPESDVSAVNPIDSFQLGGHFVSLQPQKSRSTEPFTPTNFDPSTMEADIISLELEVGPSVLCVYGCLLAHLYQVKENYLGDDNVFRDIDQGFINLKKDEPASSSAASNVKLFDARYYRPLQVKVQVTLHDMQGHLIKNCNPNDVPCPSAYLERLSFEMDKRYQETKLQVLLSPIILIATDGFHDRPKPHQHLSEGHLALSGLQVRGHAMFSHEGLPLDADTLEYGWLMEITIGDITGRLTTPQLQNIIEFLQTFIFLVEDAENKLQHPRRFEICQHGLPQPECLVEKTLTFPCPTALDLKYKFTRVSIDCIDLYLVEAGSCLNLQVYPVRIATCNLHGTSTKAGISVVVPVINVRQFVLSMPVTAKYDEDCQTWLDAGGICLGPLSVDAAMALPRPELRSCQDQFLKLHDKKTGRLWFLWPNTPIANVAGKCGCLGGCRFFGYNRNGTKFLQPADSDFVESLSCAVFWLCRDGETHGYGQSLLNYDSYVFDYQPNCFVISEKRLKTAKGKVQKVPESTLDYGASDLGMKPSPAQRPANLVLDSVLEDEVTSEKDEVSTPRIVIVKSGGHRNCGGFENLPAGSLTISRKDNQNSKKKGDSIVYETVEASEPFAQDLGVVSDGVDGTKISSSVIPGRTNSATSLPDVIEKKQFGHARKHSYDVPEISPSNGRSIHETKTSRTPSVSSGIGSDNRKAAVADRTFTSPVLQRLSSQISIYAKSLSTDSEMYFSATEDVNSDVASNSSTTISDEESETSYIEKTIKAFPKDDLNSSQNTLTSDLRSSKVSNTKIEEEGDNESLDSFVSAFQDRSKSNLLDIDITTDISKGKKKPLISEAQSEEQAENSYHRQLHMAQHHMIDLHGQINQQITLSPLLMTCYKSHMTQLRCDYWTLGSPLACVISPKGVGINRGFVDSEKSPPVPFWIPQFSYVSQGFAPRLVTTRKVPYTPPGLYSTNSVDGEKKFFADKPNVEAGTEQSVEYEEHVSKTTAIVKLKGSVDIMVSPLMLEALQRYVEAVTPVLASMHPSAIIDGLHSQCSSMVRSQNKLKKTEQSASQEIGEGKRMNGGEEEMRNDESWSDEDVTVPGKKTSRLQVMFSLSRVNICLLQASLVEETISISAIERARELTCVSLLTLCLDDLSCQFLINHHSQKFYRSVFSSFFKENTLSPAFAKKIDSGSSPENAGHRTNEINHDDNLGNLHIAHIHCQLRRMKKNSNFSDDIALTAIPEYRSKVLFTFERGSSVSSFNVDDTYGKTDMIEELAGFIMFECGMEETDLKIARRLGYDTINNETLGSTAPRYGRSANKDFDFDNLAGEFNFGNKTMESPNSMSSPVDDLDNGTDALKGNMSSFTLEIKTVWFNFAAPPPSPSKKKIEYTRLDWNLLSTATPAINAWLNPAHRAIVASRNLLHKLEFRISAVIACLLAEALEKQHQQGHQVTASKYNSIITSLSSTLTEDPSCHLITILRKYLSEIEDLTAIEKNIQSSTVPQLSTIRKGLIALVRQWKNVLHMPAMAQKGMTKGQRIAKQQYQNNALKMDGFEETDEKASLLQNADDSSYHHTLGSQHFPSNPSIDFPAVDKLAHYDFNKKAPSESQLIEMGAMKSISPTGLQQTMKSKVDGSFTSITSPTNSVSGDVTMPLPDTPHRNSFSQGLGQQKKEDLYRWVQEQDVVKLCPTPSLQYQTAGGGKASLISVSEFSQDESTALQNAERMQVMNAFQLVKAEVLFKPLLRSLSLHVGDAKTSALMKKLGGNVSTKGILHILRVDIVDSELATASGSRSSKSGKSKSKKMGRMFRIDTAQVPAFLCDNFVILAALSDIIDFEKNKIDKKSHLKHSTSLRGWNAAIEGLEAKPTTTKVTFDLSCNSVTQQINMSLLRLVHQLVTMCTNISETRGELRNVTSSYAFRGHRKQDSNGSTVSIQTPTVAAEHDSWNGKQSFQETPLSTGSPLVRTRSHIRKHSIGTTNELGTSVEDKSPREFMSSSSVTEQNSSGVEMRRNVLRRPDRLPLTTTKSSKKFAFRRRNESAVGVADVGGYSSVIPLNTESLYVEVGDTSSPALTDHMLAEEIKAETPRCWRMLYDLVNFYSTMPDTLNTAKATAQSKLSVIEEEPEKLSVIGEGDETSMKDEVDAETLERQPEQVKKKPEKTRETYIMAHPFFLGEHVRLVVFGMACIKRLHISALLSGLKLEAELQNTYGSLTFREKHKGTKKIIESSIMAFVGHTMVVLLEGIAPHMQTVVTMNVAESHGLYSFTSRRGRDHNSGLLTIGKIDFDIPQHPVALHGVVTRSSKRISNTLQEFLRPPGTYRMRFHLPTDIVDGIPVNPQSSRSFDMDDVTTPLIPSAVTSSGFVPVSKTEDSVNPHTVIHFKAVLKGLTVGSSLLPSLRAQYKMGEIVSFGATGTDAHFSLDLKNHSLSFTSKLTAFTSPLPSSAAINLPQILVHCEYKQHHNESPSRESCLSEGLSLRQGNYKYLNAVAEVARFDHSLSTDLLNHLMLVQKVFMKEVNEVLQKVSGGDKVSNLWQSNQEKSATAKRLAKPFVYSFHVRMKGIQITATTPTNSAVRLETGPIDLDLSTRVQNSSSHGNNDKPPRLFVQMHLNVNLALGTLIKNPLFEEADEELQNQALFKTLVTLRNALQDELIQSVTKDQECLLITLQRPTIWVQSSAFDKAILVWLNYKNAYEYWNEQRQVIDNEMKDAMPAQGYADKLPNNAATTNTSSLFLQLKVTDLGICLPMVASGANVMSQTRAIDEPNPSPALVLTINDTQIAALSSQSVVSRGSFHGFCVRFLDDFDPSWDDWRPSDGEIIMNAMEVPEGTYEVCVKTIGKMPNDIKSNPKWIMNVMWQMEGLDINVDTNMGKQLNMLSTTLTSLTRERRENEEEEDQTDNTVTLTGIKSDASSTIAIDPKVRTRIIEHEMNEQAKTVEGLRQRGATQGLILSEEKRLHELKGVVLHNYREGLLNRLKRQSVAATVIGLGTNKPRHARAHSTVGIGMMRNNSIDTPTPLFSTTNSATQVASSNDVQMRHAHKRTLSYDQNYQRHSVSGTTRGDAAARKLPSVGKEEESGASSISEDSDEDESNDEDYVDAQVPAPNRPLLYTAPTSSHPPKSDVNEPSIDFELDIKVKVNSGQFLLHAKETKTEGDLESKTKPQSSPRMERKKLTRTQTGLSSQIRTTTATLGDNVTVFKLPGVNMSMSYKSRVEWVESGEQTNILPTIYRRRHESGSRRLIPIKKANMYAWIELEKLSQEMLISPALMDYLEQALEPIPLPATPPPSRTASDSSTKLPPTSVSDTGGQADLDTSGISSVGTVEQGSFPVDVVVVVRVQPSTIRFTCLPVSRVECLLCFPSVDVSFSTSKVTDSDDTSGTARPVGRTSNAGTYNAGNEASAATGLSFTGCISDFSFYIFHPYGGMQKKSLFSYSNALDETSEVSGFESLPTEMQGRKESLSVNVEFVKVNISRTRRAATGSDAGIVHSGHRLMNVIQLSAVCDIGSATFKYDMRRLSEILALPKAWYRRSLVRRMFLGEETTLYDSDDDLSHIVEEPLQGKDQSSNAEKISATKLILNSAASKQSMGLGKSTQSTSRASMSPPPTNPVMTFLIPDGNAVRPGKFQLSQNVAQQGNNAAPQKGNVGGVNVSLPVNRGVREWETKVLFAVNLAKVEVSVNMSNVMGQTTWSTQQLHSEGRLCIGSSGHKTMRFTAGLGRSTLEAKSGIVGGLVEVENVRTLIAIEEELGREPSHRAQFNLHILQVKLDYMGTSMLMCRINDINLRVEDEWHVVTHRLSRVHEPASPDRPDMIYLHGKFCWDKFHMMLSRSTTPDIIKIINKLEEFFGEQMRSSKRVLSAFAPIPSSSRSRVKVRKSTEEASWIAEVRHHRHWQPVMEHIAGCELSCLSFTLPPRGTVLGGSVSLQGGNLTLACFHGINFRAKSWALFSMDDPVICFTTEAVQGIENSEPVTQIIQKLSFRLGDNLTGVTQIPSRRSRAIICKLSRGYYIPPTFPSVTDWFMYAFATNEIKGLDDFPQLRVSANEGKEKEEKSTSRKSQEKHETDIIFVLPSLQLELRTTHCQGAQVPEEGGQLPIVDCSFITEFEDVLLVAMDAEVIMFLHDLITNYVKEKDRGVPRGTRSQETDTNPTTVLKEDCREFRCNSWHLEPPIKLLSFAGRRIEPVGVDYLLQRLGFRRPNTTIPKWMQRGCMDPLDKTISMLLDKLLLALREEPLPNKNDGI